MTPFAAAPTSQRRLVIELEVVADDLAERLVRLRRFQATVEVDRGLDVAVAEQAPHDLVFAGPMLELDRCASMAELVNRHPQARGFLNALGDLGAEHVRCLRLTGDTGEQPGGI
jgi:hypothetical protein